MDGMKQQPPKQAGKHIEPCAKGIDDTIPPENRSYCGDEAVWGRSGIKLMCSHDFNTRLLSGLEDILWKDCSRCCEQPLGEEGKSLGNRSINLVSSLPSLQSCQDRITRAQIQQLRNELLTLKRPLNPVDGIFLIHKMRRAETLEFVAITEEVKRN